MKVGRNSVKIFSDNIPEELDALIRAIQAKAIEFQSFSIDQSNFFDYFQIRAKNCDR